MTDAGRLRKLADDVDREGVPSATAQMAISHALRESADLLAGSGGGRQDDLRAAFYAGYGHAVEVATYHGSPDWKPTTDREKAFEQWQALAGSAPGDAPKGARQNCKAVGLGLRCPTCESYEAHLEGAAPGDVAPYRSGENQQSHTICPACVLSDPRLRLCVQHQGGDAEARSSGDAVALAGVAVPPHLEPLRPVANALVNAMAADVLLGPDEGGGAEQDPAAARPSGARLGQEWVTRVTNAPDSDEPAVMGAGSSLRHRPFCMSCGPTERAPDGSCAACGECAENVVDEFARPEDFKAEGGEGQADAPAPVTAARLR